MNEHNLIMELYAGVDSATLHFSAMCTFVVVYIVGLYGFLKAAPLPVRLIAYGFFVGSFCVYIALGTVILETIFMQQDASFALAASGAYSAGVTEALQPSWYTPLIILVSKLWNFLVIGTVIALGWLTFFYKWDDREQA